MEIIRISSDRLKIMLSGLDREEYFCGQKIDYENEETRRALKTLLKDAGESVGFDPVAGKMLVQVFESRDGGCEMYLTKLKDKQADTDKAVPDPEIETPSFLFQNTESMIMFCKRYIASEGGSICENAKIYNCGGKWYLTYPDAVPIWIEDFCERLGNDAFCYISEYGKEAAMPINDIAGIAI